MTHDETMQEWFDALESDQREVWLDACEVGNIVEPPELVETLPEDRRPGQPKQWVRLSAPWSTNLTDPAAVRAWSQRPYMTDHLHDFLRQQLHHVRGTPAQGVGQYYGGPLHGQRFQLVSPLREEIAVHSGGCYRLKNRQKGHLTVRIYEYDPDC
jgi:hypothetical protein